MKWNDDNLLYGASCRLTRVVTRAFVPFMGEVFFVSKIRGELEG
ncbi:hypothetical protein [Bacillus horti]|uniref:Uncharacterized protein n=1 Tax=Caldalkalibacillus horti TaxID=77523 RepID=A0ABT9VWM4_9BACI|nr:hypothetical protein [Bacillus horti]